MLAIDVLRPLSATSFEYIFDLKVSFNVCQLIISIIAK